MKYFSQETAETGQRESSGLSWHICGTERTAVCNHPCAERGFSLIEMMISITIGMMIVVALVGVLVSNSRTAKSNDRTSELQSNGRYALDHLARELRSASYRGYTWASPSVVTTAIAAPTNECLDGGAPDTSFVTNVRQGIWGANDSNPYSGNCLAGDRYLSDDLLVLRHAGRVVPDADGVPPYAANLKPGTFYFHSTFGDGRVFQGTTPPAITAGPVLGDFPLQQYVYYIGKDDADTSLPALRRIALKGNGDNCNGTAVSSALMCDEMVASLIEHMQLQFGHVGTNDLTQYREGNEIPGTSTSAQQTDWEAVKSVRIWLLARNAKAEPGYKDTNTYDMGDQHFRPNDGFRRQLFTAVVQLRN